MTKILLTAVISSILFGCSPRLKSILTNTNQNLVLKNVTLIDGTGSPAREHITIHIKDGGIIGIYNDGKIVQTGAATVVDLAGKFLIPGMIDGHGHVATKEMHRGAKRLLLRKFSQGVTTTRDPLGNCPLLRELQKEALSSTVPMARVYYSALFAGPEFVENDIKMKISRFFNIDLAGDELAIVVTDSMDIPKQIAKVKAFGVDGIKVYAKVPGDLATELIREAKKQGLRAWAHVYVGVEGPGAVSEAHCLSHLDMFLMSDTIPSLLKNDFGKVFHSSTTETLLATIKQNNVVIDVTLGVMLKGFDKWEDWEDGVGEKIHELFNYTYLLTKRVFDMGIPIGVGTDRAGDVPDEMGLLVNKAKIPEIEVIKAATYNNALALGIEKDYGSIEVGKVADMVILNSNPLDDIENVRDIKYVIKEGHIYSRKRVKSLNVP